MWGSHPTLDNHKAATDGETYEYTTMYPPMVDEADKEKSKAKTMLKWACEVEKVHADLYKQALAAVQAGKDLDSLEVYLCPLCGHLELGKAPEKCPVCNLPGAKYTKVA